MTKSCLAAIALLALGATQPTTAQRAASSTPQEDGIVLVVPPTGEKATDRASILAALEKVEPGGTVQFAPGTYLSGEIIHVTVPGITLLGHPEGTILRGCDPGPEDSARRNCLSTKVPSTATHSARPGPSSSKAPSSSPLTGARTMSYSHPSPPTGSVGAGSCRISNSDGMATAR